VGIGLIGEIGVIGRGVMEEQLEYSRLLHGSGHGIALRKPTQDIEVGDICYWNPDGKATRILNVFDNKQVLILTYLLTMIVARIEQLA
jgi:hypothetical protein